MPFAAYLPQGFKHDHENRMFDQLATSLTAAFGQGNTQVYLLGNVCFGDRELDAVLLMPNAVSVIEMKSYGGVIHFSENTEWFANEMEVIGGIHRNPYWQLRSNKFGMLDHLQRRGREILHPGTINHWWHVCGIVLFGRDIQFDEKLPEAISDWFTICDQRSVVSAVSAFREPRWVSPGYKYRPLTATEMDKIVGGLALTENHLYAGMMPAIAPAEALALALPEVPAINVLLHNQSSFRNAVLRLRQSGGRKTAGAMTLLQAIQDARNGINTFSRIQSTPDSRIENAIIYHLNEEARCVAVISGSNIHLCHCGTPQEVGLWIKANVGKTFTVDAGTQRIEQTIVTTNSSHAVLAPTHMTDANVPFLQRVSSLELAKLVPSVFVRKHLMLLDENTPDEDINELLKEIDDDDVRLFLHDVISSAKAGDITGAETRVRLRRGDVCPVVDAPAMVETALVAETNSDQIVVLNELEQGEFDRLFDPLRFREWMVFLHPGQRRVSDEDFSGPALLTGVSGSGKTCVLVHRARRLAQIFSQDRILILTLNQSLARLIEVLKDDLCLGSEKDRIEVKSFHNYLFEILSSLDCAAFLQRLAQFTGMNNEVEAFLAKTPPAKHAEIFKPVTQQEQMIAFEEFLLEEGNPAKADLDRFEIFVFSQDKTIDFRRYLFDELELVRSAFTCDTDYRGYLSYGREGRSVAFQEGRREAVLNILREWERFQLRRGFLDIMGLAQAAVFAVDEAEGVPDKFRYRSVLVDEFQDLSTLELLLLKQIPKCEENGLFLTGDYAQKIYTKDLNLSAAKLGRGKRTDRIIRRNYRNSRQVLLAAQALLEAYPPQIGGNEEDVALLKPEYASKESAAPIATQASDPIRAAWLYAEEWLTEGHVPFSVCIATANNNIISTETILKRKPAGLEADLLTGDYLLRPNRVVVADISAVKGFEFSLILICGLDEGVFPSKGVPAAEQWREAMRLYVAITRGRDEVRFVYQNTQSQFLLAMGDRIRHQTWEAPCVPETAIEPAIKPVMEKLFELNDETPQVARRTDSSTGTPVPQETEVTSKGDLLADFIDRFPPEVLNGILVITIPSGATERELSKILSIKQTEVALAIYETGFIVPPTQPLPNHIILRVCDYFRCIPNILLFSRNG